ncbi:hypothetical protein GCM10020001_070500 [Nonomuraea salmonea]
MNNPVINLRRHIDSKQRLDWTGLGLTAKLLEFSPNSDLGIFPEEDKSES